MSGTKQQEEQILQLTPQQVRLLQESESQVRIAQDRLQQVLVGIFAAAGIDRAHILRMQQREERAELVYHITSDVKSELQPGPKS